MTSVSFDHLKESKNVEEEVVSLQEMITQVKREKQTVENQVSLLQNEREEKLARLEAKKTKENALKKEFLEKKLLLQNDLPFTSSSKETPEETPKTKGHDKE